MKNKNGKEDYYSDFRGVRLNKVEANRVGVGIISGFLGVLLITFLPFEKDSFINYIILFFFVLIGYFIIAPKIFKKKDKRLNGKNGSGKRCGITVHG